MADLKVFWTSIICKELPLVQSKFHIFPFSSPLVHQQFLFSSSLCSNFKSPQKKKKKKKNRKPEEEQSIGNARITASKCRRWRNEGPISGSAQHRGSSPAQETSCLSDENGDRRFCHRRYARLLCPLLQEEAGSFRAWCRESYRRYLYSGEYSSSRVEIYEMAFNL